MDSETLKVIYYFSGYLIGSGSGVCISVACTAWLLKRQDSKLDKEWEEFKLKQKYGSDYQIK